MTHGISIQERLRHYLGIDFHVLSTLLSRGWSVLAGAFTLLMVPVWLNTVEQGYYYTFSSLLGMQILFELGLGQVIIQLVGHDAAHLRHTSGCTLEGEPLQVDRIASLIQFLQRWYRVAALLFCILAGIAGGIFIAFKGQLPLYQWLPIWCVMVLASTVNLTYVPALALHEGLGLIGEVARLRLIQSVVGFIGLWIALVMHLTLWASCMVPLASMLLTRCWLVRTGRTYNWLIRRNVNSENMLDWRNDVLPFQWRIALSAISGYFIFYAFTPMIFANHGAEEAGRFGIAMAIFNALAAVGTSWVYAKAPAFAMHIARGERQELNRLFCSVMFRSVICTSTAAVLIVLLVAGLNYMGIPQVRRIAAPGVLACLAIVCGVNSIIFSVAAYMRAHKEEPMLGVSVVGAIATIFIAYFGSMYNILTMSLMYAALTSFVILPWSLVLFFDYYRRK